MNRTSLLAIVAFSFALGACGIIVDAPTVPPITPDASEDAAPSGNDASQDAATADAGGDGAVDAGDGAPDGTTDDAAHDGGPDSSDAEAGGTTCDISGKTYAPDASDPNNPCETCEPTGSGGTSGWTGRPNGTTCGAGGLTCNGGRCGTECTIDGGYVDSGELNTLNFCQACLPATSLSSWSNLAIGTSCGATGDYCNADGGCVSACVIDGGFYIADAANPANSCQVCLPSGTGGASNWSDTADGLACGDGGSTICHVGACVGGCEILSDFYGPDAGNPNNNVCQICNPTGDGGVSGWTSVANGLGCGNGQTCFGGACGTECEIDGSVVDSGTINSTGCESCQPGVNNYVWEPLSAGHPCTVSGGEFCNGAGTCVSECFIDGGLVSSSSTSANGCLICEPNVDASAWTVLNGLGSSCPGGEVCNSGSCENGCFIDGGYVPSATVNPGNGCESCQPSASTSGWSPLDGVNESACGSEAVCHGGGCVSGCFIDAGFYAATASSPSSGCLECTPSLTIVAWSNSCSATFNYTGAPQTFTVPSGITQVTITAYGAQGGTGGNFIDASVTASAGGGGLGAMVTATVPVVPGETLAVYVGGEGNVSGNDGGFNGGGYGGPPYPSVMAFGTWGGAGGDSSDVREGGDASLNNRIVVAAGGGGSGGDQTESLDGGGAGGAGGTLEGAPGPVSAIEFSEAWGAGGGGGTQDGGGAGGDASGGAADKPLGTGVTGSLGAGGGGGTGDMEDLCGAGGGGGGYYGGGGGGTGEGPSSGGGGGSSYVEPKAISYSWAAGVNAGNGQVTIAY